MRRTEKALLLLCASLLAMPGMGQRAPDATPPGAPAVGLWTIERDENGLRITGSANSRAHVAILREVALESLGQEAAARLSIDMSAEAELPPGWSLVTERVLRAVLTTRRALASVTPTRITLRGISANAARTNNTILRLKASLPPGMRLVQEITHVDEELTFDALCRRQFESRTANLRLAFTNSGADINADAYRSLDAIVELATQCPDLQFEVVGHTDASGEPDVNQLISEARAQAVKSYLEKRGLPAARISARGAGSSEPRIAASDGRARRLNRRVEVRLNER